MRNQRFNQSGYSYAELLFRTEQARHQPARVGHAEEVTRMDPDPAFQERQYGLLIRFERRNAQHRVPAALHFEPLNRWQPSQLPVQLGQVGSHTLPNLPLNL